MISQDFAHSILFLSTSHLVRILVWFEDLDAYLLRLLTINFSVGKINFRMHSVTDLLDGINGAFILLFHLDLHSEVANDALALVGGVPDGLDLLASLTNGTLWMAQIFELGQLRVAVAVIGAISHGGVNLGGRCLRLTLHDLATVDLDLSHLDVVLHQFGLAENLSIFVFCFLVNDDH